MTLTFPEGTLPSRHRSRAHTGDDRGEGPAIPHPGDGAPADGTSAARPVAIDVDARHDEPLRRWVEGVLGWQVVDRATDGLVPPTVHLVGAGAEPPDDGIPRVLVLGAGDDPAAAATAALRGRPALVVRWPEDRDELAPWVAEVVDAPTGARAGPQVLRVGGVAGGVGTTTVALALGGLAAWRGQRTLVAIRGDAPVAGVPVVAASALGASDVAGRVPVVAGVGELRAVRIGDPAPAAEPIDPALALAVLDQGVDTDVDVLVCRPDAAALAHLPATAAAAVIVVGLGLVRPQELVAAAGGRRLLHLPWSSRVARAGLRRRVPATLPGAWLKRLQPLLPRHVDGTWPDRDRR